MKIRTNSEYSRKRALKRLVKARILPLFCREIFQPFARVLFRLSLIAQNIGPGGEVDSSGELWVLTHLAKILNADQEWVLFDVGANIGNWSKMACDILPNVALYCFEPSSATRQMLEANLGMRGNVHIQPLGAGSSAQILTLQRAVDSGCASLYKRRGDEYRGVEEKVEIVRIDEFCRRKAIDVIHFLKMDIEGHELEALRGCGDLLATGKIRIIQFEFGGCNIDARTFFRDFWELLDQTYNIYRILPRGLWRIAKYDETLEVFTTTNFLAISRDIRF